ncbi:aminoglycoside phosphotransferase (APT) family kinase protein [Tamaricihabitans halophyticus]|uniref:Aminoglycoside phosphotransferase (APT) family kinase protein n=1 Tax=Tamaricihabitans halophyticus TaxID=1262583 RepID=A0A4V2STF3_9PSEU|nr:phosphotransferase family protein [Tamaricihabitans halophyticus]TCP50106.1 aminoglycoside phosphotransferase (APT) family kinase protein [Tamaricihabitans halophyticus]
MTTQLPGLDLARVTDYLAAERPGLLRGELTAELIAGGRSNLTYVLHDRAAGTDPTGENTHSWVLRRPPLGHVLATAHDMGREYRVISALADTPVPVPETILLCTDTDVLGAPFYLMRHVSGTPYRTVDQLTTLGAERTNAIGMAVVDTLADLHAVQPESVGLADFGRPEGFLERQVRRWGKQLAGSYSRDIPGIDRLHEKLGQRLPASPDGTIVHGDFRLDNMLLDANDRVTAVLDWEMSTLGDPNTDLGLLVVYDALGGLDGANPISTTGDAPGYPTTGEQIERYAARSGRDLSQLDWYIAFGYFKLAVIIEGIYYRHTHGQTVGSGFEHIGELVAPLVADGLATLKEN